MDFMKTNKKLIQALTLPVMLMLIGWTPMKAQLSNPTACQLGLSIADNSCFSGGDVFDIEVLSAVGTVLGTDVELTDVNLIIEHTWDSDLEVELVSPNGVVVSLFADVGSSGDNFGDPSDGSCNSVTNLNMDGADGSIGFGSAPFIGSYIPQGDFATFNDGSNPVGVWQLRVCDDASGDTGELEYVELVFGVPCEAPSNLMTSSLTNVSVDLSWTPGANCGSGAEYWVLESGMGAPSSGTGTALACAPSFPIAVSSLSEQTTYNVWVLEDCGVTPVNIGSFTTLATPLSNPTACQLGLSIADNSCFGGGDVFGINVASAAGTVLGTDIELTDVNLIIEHTWDSDLEVELVSPNGVVVSLFADVGSSGDNFGDPTDGSCNSVTNLNMNGADGSIGSGSAPFIGSYIPEGDFTAFNDGSSPVGVWQLRVCDDASGDTGELEYVELVFGAPCEAPSNLMTSSLTDVSVDLSWTPGANCGSGAEYWVLESGMGAPSSGTGTALACAPSFPIAVSSLSEQTTYNVWVLEDCGVTPVNIGSFTTLAAPLSNPTACQLGLSIADNSCFGGGDVFGINVASAAGTVLGTDVELTDVNLIIEHTWDSDLEVELVSPNGVVVSLFADVGSSGDNFGDPSDGSCNSVTNLNMNGADGSIGSGSAPFIGSYIPEGDFTAFNDGSSPVGVWQLRVCDDASGDTGELEYVELVFGALDPCAGDMEAPMINCPGTVSTAGLGANCQKTLSDYTVFADASDNCDTDLTLTQSPLAGEIITGEQDLVVTVTATDDAGLMNSCTYTVPFRDVDAPDITCPMNATVQATGATCTPAVNDIAAVVSDNCTMSPLVTYSTMGATMASGNGDLSGSTFAVGTTTVTYTAADDAMTTNTATCSFTVTVEDNTTCGCGNPQPGDSCDDGDPMTGGDVIQGDCSCAGSVGCDIMITSIDVSDETCAGDEDGSITINATCTTCTGILYSIDGGMTTQASPTFTGLSPDTYQPFVIDSGNNSCTDTDMDAIVNMGDPLPADPVAEVATKSLCVNPDLSPSLTNSGIKVMNDLTADERVVWVLTSAPAGSAFAANDEFTIDNCGDPFNNYGELAVAFSSKVIRIQDIENAPVGTYTFDTYIENCVTGCISGTTSGFSITVNAAPSVMITAAPEGDLCLGQEDVQYNAVVTSTDGGTYSYLWCAYNSGDGSGSCFNGFDNNTAQDPMRDWTSSTGAKSVGVTATSDVAGCEAEDLYSFEVVAPTMVECPDDIMETLETDPMTYDCTTDITFNHPMVEAGACDPVNLTLEITGPSGAGPAMVTPGEEYVFSVEDLGTYTVSYNLVDVAGNTSTCSFDITVDGLLCGWVDNGGIGDCAGENGSDYDPETETFNVTSNGCVPAFPYTGDNQAFINTQLCGDGYIEVFVDNITAKGFAGISLRESQAAGAKKVEIGTDNVARIIRAARVIDGYPAFPQELISFDKFWLKIERTGNTFRASASTDGVSYTPYLFQTIMMGECLEAGLWAYSTNPEDVVTATFNNVTVVEYGGADLQAPVTNLAQSQTDLGAFDVSLTPNPAKEQVTLNLEQLIGQEVMIRLYNINGQLMQQQPIEAVGTATHRLDLSYLPKGAYWVQVQSASGQKTMKLIKQ